MRKKLIRFAVIVLLACLISAVLTFGLSLFWMAIGGGDLTTHGWIAMTLGVLGTCGLAWGLMSLAFRSHREGWDDRVDNSLDPGRDTPDKKD